MVDLCQLWGNRHYLIWHKVRVVQTHDTASAMKLVSIKLPFHKFRNRFKPARLICPVFGHGVKQLQHFLFGLRYPKPDLSCQWTTAAGPQCKTFFSISPQVIYPLLCSYTHCKMKASVLHVEYNAKVLVAYLETTSPSCSHMLLPCLQNGRVLFVLESH